MAEMGRDLRVETEQPQYHQENMAVFPKYRRYWTVPHHGLQ